MPKLFPSQQPQEKIYIAVREHWFRLFVRFAFVIILAALPLIITFLIDLPTTLFGDNVNIILDISIQVYYLGLVVAAFIIWVLYYLNLHIVSDMRIVDIDQRGLLKHEVSELNLETIEDVTSDTVGLFGNFLDYGTVYIQTAGATERFEFENVPEPAKIASVILTLYEKQRKLSPNPQKP